MLRRLGAVIAINMSTMRQRVGASLVVLVGIAGVVAVLISVLAMSVGFTRTVLGAGRADRAIVLATGALTESLSSIPRTVATTIMSAPGIAKDASGRPVADAEVLASLQRPKKGGGRPVNVVLRGVGLAAPSLRPEIRIIQGRLFRPALHELIVGRRAQYAYEGLSVGDRVPFQNDEWTVVGVFDSEPASALESEVMTDAESLLSALQRNWFQSVSLLLDARPDSFERVQRALAADPALHVSVRAERDYLAAQSRGLGLVLKFVAYFVGSVMAAGTLFSCLNIMYSSVSARALEISTLRAIGFGGSLVALSVILEALMLALLGATLGASIAWLCFDGHTASMISGPRSSLVFSLMVTPSLVVLGVVWACVIGLLGGLLPAWRAARLPVAAALRKTT